MVIIMSSQSHGENIIARITEEKWSISPYTWSPTEGEGTRPIFSVDTHTDEDQGLLAIASDPPEMKILDLATGNLVNTLGPNPGGVHAVAFSPDGRSVAAGGYDGTLRIWNVHTGELEKTLTGHSDIIRSLCYGEDSASVLTGSDDGKILRWNIVNGEIISSYSTYGSQIIFLMFLPGDSRFVSGDFSGLVGLWDVSSTEPLFQTTVSRTRINAIAVNSSGTRLVVVSNDGNIALFAISEKTLLKENFADLSPRTLKWWQAQIATSVVWLDSRDIIVLGLSNGGILPWSIDQWEKGTVTNIHESTVSTLKYSSGKLVTGSWDGTVKVFELE